MKENSKVNPLKYFNDNKAAAVKKAGGDMSAYKKSLKKAQAGQEFKESVLAKEYANAPIAGAEPEWSYLEGQKMDKFGPRTSGYQGSPYNMKRTIKDSKGKKITYDNSSAMNDPRFSTAMEKTNEFYNKEKNAGTLFKKGFGTRMQQNRPAPGTINTLVNDTMKKGGSVKKMQNGGKVNAPKKPTITSDGQVNADGSKPKTMAPPKNVAPGPRIKNINQVNKPKTVAPVSRPKVFDPNSKSKTVAPGSRPRPLNPDKRPTVTKSAPQKTISSSTVTINKKNTGAINKAHAAGKTVYIPRNKYGGSITKKK
jgi:hypothetical protein